MISNHKWFCLHFHHLYRCDTNGGNKAQVPQVQHIALAKMSAAALIFHFLERSMVVLNVYRIFVDELGATFGSVLYDNQNH